MEHIKPILLRILKALGLTSSPEHICDESGSPDTDICTSCGEHASFCSDCGQSSCCDSGPVNTDPDTDMER